MHSHPNQPREQDRIQCRECGRWYRALPTHLLRTHDLDDEDYRLKYGIPVGLPLVCREWSETQTRRNIERDAKRTLTARGSHPGYAQRESVRQHQRPNYARLAAAGTAAAAQLDKTVHRRELLRPYPVTVAQAAERLGCSMRAAYNFLSYCLTSGRLRRISRGLYGEVPDGLE
jgi:uncharacterized protein YbaR (Trm112 family)